MSGSALSPDAMVSNAGHVTRQVAAQLNCPLSDEDLIVCLRNKEVQDLLSVQVKFLELFGHLVSCKVMWNIY